MTNNAKQKSQTTASVMCFVLLVVYPLIMTNGYLNLLVTKTVTFCFTAYICGVICFFQNEFKKIDDSNLNVKRKLSKTDASMLAFIGVCTLSVVFSEHRYEALTGCEGRFMGFITMFAIALCYFVFTRFFVLEKKHIIAFGVASSVISSIVFLQFCNIDVFGLYKKVKASQHILFVSTLGNINVFSSFVCLCAPLFMYLFCMKKSKYDILKLLVCFVSFVSLFVCNSDSGYLGIGAAFVVLSVLSLSSFGSFRRFLIICLVFLLSSKAVYLFVSLTGDLTRHMYFLSKTLELIKITYIFILILFLSLIIFLKVRLSEKVLMILKICLVSIYIFLFVAMISAVFYFSKINTEIDLNEFGNYLRVNENWGTFRGYIWKRTFEIFSNTSLVHKLFGLGEDTLRIYMDKYFLNEMEARSFFVDNAHNDFIQYLVTTGIFGLASYVSVLVCGIGGTLKRKDVPDEYKAFAFAAFAFAVQSVVNITQPVTTPFIFIFISIAQSYEAKNRCVVERDSIKI